MIVEILLKSIVLEEYCKPVTTSGCIFLNLSNCSNVKISSSVVAEVKIFQASNPKSFFPSILVVPLFAELNPPYRASVAASAVNCKSTSNDFTIDLSDNTEN